MILPCACVRVCLCACLFVDLRFRTKFCATSLWPQGSGTPTSSTVENFGERACTLPTTRPTRPRSLLHTRQLRLHPTPPCLSSCLPSPTRAQLDPPTRPPPDRSHAPGSSCVFLGPHCENSLLFFPGKDTYTRFVI